MNLSPLNAMCFHFILVNKCFDGFAFQGTVLCCPGWLQTFCEAEDGPNLLVLLLLLPK